MAAVSTDTGFIVWGIDQTAYGPVELPTLVSWVKDERVTADTWIYAAQNASWQKAADVPELQMFFRSKRGARPADTDAVTSLRGIDPRALRRIKILAGMTDDQLERFAQFVEVEKVPQWSVIVKQGDPGDVMYFILDGELRVRLSVMGSESILATLSAGEFFGDVSLFDHGPRSADVVANCDSTVVKISAAAFDELAKAAPDIATPFLRAVGRTLSARIRTDNKRYGDSVKFARTAG
ncbi:MAG TPA: cyclic nucleotide-binding domain-containing protein [Verrucomicrobiota bacterium]|nr:cyclic nucleotide-binding domain-containing protein [Verrucomicrobiota bacterium]